MGIPESQLNIWSHKGSIKQSSETYATIKRALEAADTKYATKNFEVFLQGSYGNDTNIYAESDVDVVIRLDSTFHYDVSDLTPTEAAAFDAAYGRSQYAYSEFKSHVIAALQKSFGAADVKPDKKAVKIEAKGNRRSADVVIATDFWRVSRFPSIVGARVERGISFFITNGRIVNYPKQHSANCTAKHQATGEWFKPMVRIFKNMRSKLVNDGVIADGSAPSYFLEGLLYNVPNDKFGTTYGDTFVAAMNWILGADGTKLVCANEQYYLARDSAAECWPCTNCDGFISAAVDLWNNWS